MRIFRRGFGLQAEESFFCRAVGLILGGLETEATSS